MKFSDLLSCDVSRENHILKSMSQGISKPSLPHNGRIFDVKKSPDVALSINPDLEDSYDPKLELQK